MIAGEGLVGMLLAILAVIPMKNKAVIDVINLKAPLGQLGSVIFFGLIISFIIYFSRTKKTNKVNE